MVKIRNERFSIIHIDFFNRSEKSKKKAFYLKFTYRKKHFIWTVLKVIVKFDLKNLVKKEIRRLHLPPRFETRILGHVYAIEG